MNVAALAPKPLSLVAFELYPLRRIADSAGCYCLTNATGDVLYVGQAVSVRRRLVDHFSSDKRHLLTPRGRISCARWRQVAPLRLDQVERSWIEAVVLCDGILPVFNRQGGSV